MSKVAMVKDFHKVIRVLEGQDIKWLFSDIDGTISSPSPIATVYSAAAKKFNINLEPEDVIPWLGKISIENPAQAQNTAFSHFPVTIQTIEDIITEYKNQFLNSEGDVFVPHVYPDVSPVLGTLQRKGINVCVITTRTEELAFHQLKLSNLLGFLYKAPRGYSATQGYAICGGDTPAKENLSVPEVPQGKKYAELCIHIDRLHITQAQRCVVVGDSDEDILACEDARMQCVKIQRTVINNAT